MKKFSNKLLSRWDNKNIIRCVTLNIKFNEKLFLSRKDTGTNLNFIDTLILFNIKSI